VSRSANTAVARNRGSRRRYNKMNERKRAALKEGKRLEGGPFSFVRRLRSRGPTQARLKNGAQVTAKQTRDGNHGNPPQS